MKMAIVVRTTGRVVKFFVEHGNAMLLSILMATSVTMAHRTERLKCNYVGERFFKLKARVLLLSNT